MMEEKSHSSLAKLNNIETPRKKVNKNHNSSSHIILPEMVGQE